MSNCTRNKICFMWMGLNQQDVLNRMTGCAHFPPCTERAHKLEREGQGSVEAASEPPCFVFFRPCNFSPLTLESFLLCSRHAPLDSAADTHAIGVRSLGRALSFACAQDPPRADGSEQFTDGFDAYSLSTNKHTVFSSRTGVLPAAVRGRDVHVAKQLSSNSSASRSSYSESVVPTTPQRVYVPEIDMNRALSIRQRHTSAEPEPSRQSASATAAFPSRPLFPVPPNLGCRACGRSTKASVPESDQDNPRVRRDAPRILSSFFRTCYHRHLHREPPNIQHRSLFSRRKDACWRVHVV